MTESDEQLYRRDDRARCARHKQWISLSDGCPDCAEEPRCETCVNYRIEKRQAPWATVEHCTLSRPLVPCEEYEREVGADDE